MIHLYSIIQAHTHTHVGVEGRQYIHDKWLKKSGKYHNIHCRCITDVDNKNNVVGIWTILDVCYSIETPDHELIMFSYWFPDHDNDKWHLISENVNKSLWMSHSVQSFNTTSLLCPFAHEVLRSTCARPLSLGPTAFGHEENFFLKFTSQICWWVAEDIKNFHLHFVLSL